MSKEYVRAMQELRRSNAATRHVLKKHKKTRGARKREAIKEQTGAYGRLSRLLKITVNVPGVARSSR